MQTLDWVSNIQPQLFPILLEDYDTCKEVNKELERKEQIVIPEIKRAEAEIELRLKAAELLALKGKYYQTVKIKNYFSENFKSSGSLFTHKSFYFHGVVFKNLYKSDFRSFFSCLEIQ